MSAWHRTHGTITQGFSRVEFSEAFPFLSAMEERRLKRHLDATAMGFGGFGIWGENRRRHGPGGVNDPPPPLDFAAYLAKVPREYTCMKYPVYTSSGRNR
jgi:hypothetical protein